MSGGRLPIPIIAVIALSATLAGAAPHMRFEVATFNATPEYSVDHYNQAMFDRLNIVSPFGPYHFMMGSDLRRSQVEGKGNTLSVYYNTLTTLYTQSAHNPVTAADALDFYVRDRFTDTGPAPTWISLNEISSSLWQGSAEYRTWLVDTMQRAHDHYGYELIVFSPFSNPGANDATWQALTQHAYIGVEHYLSGAEVKAANFSVAWAQSLYGSSKTSYMARGVPEERIFLTENFGQTVAGTGWGRAGVTADEWEQAIRVRDEAILNADFAGFLSYAWGKNGMQVSDAELLRFEDAHMSMRVLQSEVPEPGAGVVVGCFAAAVVCRRRQRASVVATPASPSDANPRSDSPLRRDRHAGVATTGDLFAVALSRATSRPQR